MKTLFTTAAAIAVVAALALGAVAVAAPAPALAHDAPAATVGAVSVVAPWARATAPQAKVGGTYMTLTTTGPSADRLVGAETPVAERAELHTHLMDNGVMRMRPVEGIAVEPGTPTALQPGGLHIMLMGLKGPLKEGTTFPLTLTFAEAGAVTVQVPVQAAGAMGAAPHAMH